MNMNDHPDLTAYALGELDAEHAEAMARWISENPDARAELEGLNDLAAHLQSTAPVAVARLHPHQRDAVLHGPERVRQMVAAAVQQNKKRRPILMPIIRNLGRMAAAAAFLVAGYAVGTHFAKQTSSADLAKTPEPAKQIPSAAQQPIKPFKAVDVPQVVVQLPEESHSPALVVAKEEPKTPAEQPKVAVAEVKPAPAAKEPVPMVAKAPAPINRVIASAFVNTTRESHSEVTLRPADTRPPAPASTGPVAAALVKEPNNKPDLQPARPSKPTELRIHSWKAEVASCPWDESRRLIRLVVQIPGSQAAANEGLQYSLRVGFDAKYVRSFRTLGERSLPASETDSPAFHIAWYEFVPNGPAVTGDTARIVGSVTLPNAQFTKAATGPFDSTTLQIVDRGANWSTTRDDFLFESAVMGFGLLLKGEKDIGTLNHELVLDLAKRAAGHDDRDSEHAKFAKLVQDAQKAAGLKVE